MPPALAEVEKNSNAAVLLDGGECEKLTRSQNNVSRLLSRKKRCRVQIGKYTGQQRMWGRRKKNGQSEVSGY
jgi:hypothetical protein